MVMLLMAMMLVLLMSCAVRGKRVVLNLPNPAGLWRWRDQRLPQERQTYFTGVSRKNALPIGVLIAELQVPSKRFVFLRL